MTEEVTLAEIALREIRTAWFAGRASTRREPYDSEAVEAAWQKQVERIANQPPAQDGRKAGNDYPAIGEALERLLDGQHILRAWRCFDGGYMVAVCQNNYWAPSINDALQKALSALGDKP